MADPKNLMWLEACALIDRAERLQRQFFRPGMVGAPEASWEPPIDIFETENELVLKADVPEVDPNSIDVRVENQTLTIGGERPFQESRNGNKGFHRIERNYGKFVRSFAVPNTFDTEKIAAAYRNGVLTVTLPKKEAAKPRQVKIEVQA